MSCRYGNVDEKQGNYLATIGTFTTVFEGRLLPDYSVEQCFFTKEEIENMDLDILEVIKIEDKYKGFQEFIQMAIRWGAKIDDITRIPYTHEERIRLANDFTEKVRKMPYISSTKIIGSAVKGTDRLKSDVDITITTKTCPGEKKCEIVKLMKDYILEPLDVWCATEKVKDVIIDI